MKRNRDWRENDSEGATGKIAEAALNQEKMQRNVGAARNRALSPGQSFPRVSRQSSRGPSRKEDRERSEEEGWGVESRSLSPFSLFLPLFHPPPFHPARAFSLAFILRSTRPIAKGRKGRFEETLKRGEKKLDRAQAGNAREEDIEPSVPDAEGCVGSIFGDHGPVL
ncbi:hypothetical protein K0M31_017052 [Melipona bicolor]|uniref:Uncharacterized protein n=1 Tax=Melipona bicolor TaxID=60889 RepID=A0AA40FDL0_9HYME|nr:hypothetical protein K0M31_017052 [Melipona bicolor]